MEVLGLSKSVLKDVTKPHINVFFKLAVLPGHVAQMVRNSPASRAQATHSQWLHRPEGILHSDRPWTHSDTIHRAPAF